MSLFRQALIFTVVAEGRLVMGQTSDQLPIVNVRLGPPANALPQVAAEISLLEGARKEMQSAHLQELDLAFANAVKHARTTIPEVVTSALGRLALQAARVVFTVDQTAPDIGVKDQNIKVRIQGHWRRCQLSAIDQ